MSIALQDPISQFHIHDLPFIIIYYQTFNVTMKLHLAIAAILSTTIDGGGITVVDPQQVVVSDSSHRVMIHVLSVPKAKSCPTQILSSTTRA